MNTPRKYLEDMTRSELVEERRRIGEKLKLHYSELNRLFELKEGFEKLLIHWRDEDEP